MIVSDETGWKPRGANRGVAHAGLPIINSSPGRLKMLFICVRVTGISLWCCAYFQACSSYKKILICETLRSFSTNLFHINNLGVKRRKQCLELHTNKPRQGQTQSAEAHTRSATIYVVIIIIIKE